MHRVPLGLPAAQRLTQPAKGYNTKTLAPSTRCLRSTTQSTRQALPTLEAQLCTYLHHRHHSQHHPTMSFVLPGLRRGLLLSAPLILSAPLLAQHVRFGQRIQCDGPDPLTKITSDLTSNYTTEARTPVITQSGAVNPRAIRQISMGSILGVIGGLGISVFSKPLAVLIGLGILVHAYCGARLSTQRALLTHLLGHRVSWHPYYPILFLAAPPEIHKRKISRSR